jgi:hypothetical protein
MPKVSDSRETPTDTDVLAGAYRELERAVCDQRNASILLETMMDDALVKPDPVAGDSELCRFDLTKDQWDGLVYAIHHVGNLARGLSKEFYAAFERLPGRSS